ncbi:MAG: CxxC-x17-CxxC domain-containing protein [Candidatus Paceibacterota bacterium]
MGDFNRGGFGGNRGGDRGGFQKKSFGGGNRGGGFGGGRGGDRGPVSMHKAVCDECQKNCEVPFRPSGDKPIYCSDCFGGKKEGGDRAPRKDFGNRDARPSFGDRAPRAEFSKPAAPANDNTAKQLSEISAKLDRLVSSIEKLTATPKVESNFVKVAPVVSAPKVEAKKVEAKKAAPTAKAPAKKAAPAKAALKAPAKKVVAKKKK